MYLRNGVLQCHRTCARSYQFTLSCGVQLNIVWYTTLLEDGAETVQHMRVAVILETSEESFVETPLPVKISVIVWAGK